MAESIIGTLVYKITGDSSALEASLDKSQKKITKTGESLTKLGKTAKTVGTVVFSGVFIKSCLEAASKVEELGNKFDTVFNGMESSADAWARKYAEDTNRGVTATKEFLATQQDLRTGYGDTVESAARFSQAVVGVTNDLASFSNVPVADAMASIQSGLAGNFQSLKTLGVGLNEQILNEGAYAKALGKTWSQMNNLERQEAILSGIMSQSKNAIHQNVQIWTDYNYQLGDAAKTSDSFANSVQGAQQRLEDLKAELGDSLLPIATDLLGFANDIIKEFNSWDDSAQRLTVALLAVGAAMVAVGGPVGTVLGTLGGLLVLFSGNRDASDDLADATSRLKAITGEYDQVTKKLSGNTDDLTTAERKLLEIQQKRLKLEIDSKMAEVASSYSNTTQEVEKLTDAEERERGRLAATGRVLEGLEAGNLRYAQEEYFRLVEIVEAGGKLSGYQAGLWQQYSVILNQANDALSKSLYDADDLEALMMELEETYEFIFNEIPDKAENAQTANLNLEESLLNLAIAYKNGVLNLEEYSKVYPDLVQKIMETAESLGDLTDEIDGGNDVTETAIKVSRQWRDQRRAQMADLLEEQEKYQEAADLRKQMLEDEQKDALHALAVSSQIIKEEEELTDERLQALLASDEEFKAEYDALNAYYLSEMESVQKDAEDAIKASNDRQEQELREHNELMADLNSQARSDRLDALGVEMKIANASRESLAAQLESEGRYAEAANVRIQALKAEYDQNEKNRKAQLRSDIEQMASKMGLIEADEDITQLEDRLLLERISATNEGLEAMSAMSEKYRQEGLLAEQQFNDKKTQIASDAADKQKAADDELARIREANAKTWADKLLQQSIAAQKSSASELEAAGKLKEAYAIRFNLIDEELQRELDALQVKIDAGEASEQDKTNLLEYYANQRKELEADEAAAEADIVEKNLKDQKDKWKSFLSELKGLVSDFGSAYVSLYSVMTDNAIAEIDRQTQARLEALGIAEKSEMEKLQDEYDEAVRSGDMELAREKQNAIQRLQIEQEADEEKAKLQREQAERERSLRIFTTTLDMLSAIVKYLADPGGWAGVGLSAMAATTGALQIAAIRQEALPSFAVGANYVPDDMLAMIHKGETILPAPMAESVRRGDAVFGQVQVNVNIENYSSEDVSVSSDEGMDGQNLTIIIGKAVEEGISSGRYDDALGSRYGVRRVGRNVR